ncbi:hypothetical protein K492DRAFT_122467 [Lichtheimia hyalospora FSU 10163]|nr:hypothetical protein K492DRAFT_122467 [Lichtheimia hyalospora FSU 10163]
MPFFIDREDKPQWESAADQLNRLIQNDVVNLNKHHHALELDLIDIHSLLTDVMSDPSMFNFVNALDAYLDACHGKCTDNVDAYVWWDRTHITGGMHRLIANSILLAGSYGKSMSLDASVGDVTAWINAPNSPYRSPKYTLPPHTGVIERVMQQIAAESTAPIFIEQDDFDTDLFINHRLLTVASLLLLAGILVIVWIRQQRKTRGSAHQLGILGSFATQEQQHRRFRTFSPPFHSSGSSSAN